MDGAMQSKLQADVLGDSRFYSDSVIPRGLEGCECVCGGVLMVG